MFVNRLMMTMCVLLGLLGVSWMSLAGRSPAADVASACAEAASVTDWTGWRGPQRDGFARGFEAPAEWPADLQRRWQVDVGTGYGTPLVADGLVYLHTRQDGREVVRCLELETGKVKWRQSHQVPFQIGSGAERHGKGPKSSPVLARNRLFTLSITGVLSAWDAVTGELLWRRDYDSQFKKSHPYWGAATSPVVDGNRVIAHFGTDGHGVLAALNVKTGKEVWTVGGDGPSYSSPLLAKLHGIRQVVQWNRRALVGVDSQTGSKLWEYEFPHTGSNQNMPTPVIHNGHILLGGENRGMYCLDPRAADGNWSVEEVWYQDKIALDMSSAVINADLLFGFSHYASGRFFCLDPESGEVLWQGPPRTGENVAFLAIQEHVVALINDGELKVISADGDRYHPVASYRVADGKTWASPVLTSCGMLIKDKRTLSLWEFEEGSASAEE